MYGSSELPTGSYSHSGRGHRNETQDSYCSCFDLFVEHVCRCRRTDGRKKFSEQFEIEPECCYQNIPDRRGKTVPGELWSLSQPARIYFTSRGTRRGPAHARTCHAERRR